MAKGQRVPVTLHPPPESPFEYLMINYIELTPSEGKKYCLVMVDMWSKRIDVFPTSKADTAAVVRALLVEVVPRWGIPQKISDKGSHFVNEVIKKWDDFCKLT